MGGMKGIEKPAEPVIYTERKEPVSAVLLREEGVVLLGPEATKEDAPHYLGKPCELTALLRENGNASFVRHYPLDKVVDHGFSDELLEEFARFEGRFVFCMVSDTV